MVDYIRREAYCLGMTGVASYTASLCFLVLSFLEEGQHNIFLLDRISYLAKKKQLKIPCSVKNSSKYSL